MNNEAAVRQLIRGSIQRAVQESVAALVVVIYFASFLSQPDIAAARFYGCLLILVGCGFIVGVVWSHALSYRLLRSHPASETGFWREAFDAQARLLRLVPYWYCTPLLAGALLFVAPANLAELTPFLFLAAIFVAFFVGITWLNRSAAACIEAAARSLAD